MNRVYKRPMQDAVMMMFTVSLTLCGERWWSKRMLADQLGWTYRQAESAVDRLAARGKLVPARWPDPVTGAKLWRLA